MRPPDLSGNHGHIADTRAWRGPSHFGSMIDIRPFASLGHADHRWLNARHHFSFADYHDRARMGWGAIIGETRIEIEAQEDSELVLVDAR
jgi:hypothetical protein